MSAEAVARKVVIIGGGFSGALVAINLARLAGRSLSVTVVNPVREPGRGAAYGSSRPEHLLNVAARNMSALPDRPTHFVEWLRTRCEYAETDGAVLRETFVPRRVYGDYVRALFESCHRPVGDAAVTVSVVDGEAVSLGRADGRDLVRLADGGLLPADAVVLATGNQPPAAFAGAEELTGDSRWCGNPWGNWHRELPPAGGHMVLLGTGLTMVDAVLTLEALNWRGRITAVSRSGTLPRAHFRGTEYPDYLPADARRLDLASLVKLVEAQCARLRAAGQNPGIAIDKLRPHTPRLWRGLSVADRRTFLRDHATRWNNLRHRIAPSVRATLSAALESGRLKIVTGAIAGLAGRDDGLGVSVRTGDGETCELTGDRVVNCTGPQSGFTETEVPLYRSLLESGLATADELNMGLRATEDFRVLDREDRPSSWLYAMGPLLKGSRWETTAVPELRVQAMQIARQLLDLPALAPPEAPVIEYCI